MNPTPLSLFRPDDDPARPAADGALAEVLAEIRQAGGVPVVVVVLRPATPQAPEGDRAVGVVADAGVPAATARGHEPDFRVVRWDGRVYEFNERQARVVGELWRAMERGTHAVPKRRLLDAAGSDADRLRDVFKAGDRVHPAWGRLVVRASSNGLYRLAP